MWAPVFAGIPCIFAYITPTREKAKSVGRLREDHAVSISPYGKKTAEPQTRVLPKPGKRAREKFRT